MQKKKIKKGQKLVYFLPIFGLSFVLGGCGSPFSEDEMVIRELKLLKEEVAVLNQELEEIRKEREALQFEVQQILNQLAELEKNREQVRNPTEEGGPLKNTVLNHQRNEEKNL